jgi:hypothetical protein
VTPAEATTETLVLVSDLHMGPGHGARTEPFHADAAFAAWLEQLRRRAGDDERVMLVLLGDIVDFTLVTLPGGGRLDMSAAAAVPKLRCVAAGHADVFRALGRLAAAGVPLHLIPGNHDLEWLLPEVREELRAALGRAAGAPIRPIAFHPWMLHVPGTMYAEHGHQHHDLNRVPALARLGGGRRIPRSAVPAGTHLSEWMVATSEAVDPGGSAPPSTATIAAALRRHPARLLLAAAPTVRLAAGVARWSVASAIGRRRTTRGLDDTAVAHVAAAVGVPGEALVAVDRSAGRGPMGTAARIARDLRARRHGTAPVPGGYLDDAARRLNARLKRTGDDVPFYVFAHSHVAADRPLDSSARILNTGTWSTFVLGGAAAWTFVELRRGRDGVSGGAYRWDGGSMTPLRA